MRKYVIGIVIGFCLSLGTSVNAEISTMIGKLVDGVFKVTVDGAQLDKEAIVIEGTTYLPVRSFGEAIGYNVSFDADLGVGLTKKQAVSESVYSGPLKRAVDPAQEAYRQSESLVVNSNTLALGGELRFIRLDDNQYMTVSPLAKYANYSPKDGKLTLTFPDKDRKTIILPMPRPKYQKDIEAFEVFGLTFVKLSSLGLIAEVRDNVIWIEKQ